MKASLVTLLAIVGVLGAPQATRAQGVIERFVLVAGANFGGSDRPELRYAVSDAERFATVMTDLGGVSPSNAIVLREPKLREFVEALDELSGRVATARRASAGTGGRTEVLVYYSGHADEKGLLLGEDRYSYQSLRDRLDEIGADVRIAVLDACASGAFTRAKGGRKRPAFLVDASTAMTGHAFLTSSAETESAQESDRIGASFFTHYLVSGLRGAADMNGEGKVTLNEAYQFAFNETLGTTLDTKGGAQHPSYDINMAGTGDVVMTDLRQTTATLVIAETIDGRIYVRNAKQELIVELYKSYGRRVELGLEPGEYQIRVERERSAMLATSVVGEGQRVVVEPGQFTPTTPEPTRRRGDDLYRYAVTGRNRLELRLGVTSAGGYEPTGPSVITGSDGGGLLPGLQYTRFLRERLAITVGAHVHTILAGTATDLSGSTTGSQTVVWLPAGLRWNPLQGDYMRKSVKPYLSAGIGPVVGATAGVSNTHAGAVVGSKTQTSIGGLVGAGVDVHLARSFTLGLSGGFNWMIDFKENLGGRDNFSGFDFGVSLGWMFGRGSTPRS